MGFETVGFRGSPSLSKKPLCILMEIIIASVPRLGNHSQHTTPFWKTKKAYLLLPVDSTTNTYMEIQDDFRIYIRASTESAESIDSHWRSLRYLKKISCISTASLLYVSCLWKISIDKVRRHRQINIFLNQLRRSNMSRAERVMGVGDFRKQWI